MKDIREFEFDNQACDEGLKRFTAVMRQKLDAKAQQGRGGWNDPSILPMKRLKELLREHVEKGDPVDIANFCMMLWNRQFPRGDDQ